jgi:hypothetical protein
MAENQQVQSHRHVTTEAVTDHEASVVKPKPGSVTEHLPWQDDLGSGFSDNLEEIGQPCRLHRSSQPIVVSLEISIN